MQLSLDFFMPEFTWSAEANVHVIPSKIQVWLARNLANNVLQKGRDVYGKFTIIGGIRDAIIYKALKDAGYNPSYRTDHSFGDPEVYQYGVGAVDFVPAAELWDVFKWYVTEDKEERLTLGQIILYEDSGFIHIANPKSLVYRKNFLHVIGVKDKYLVKRDDMFQPYTL